MRRGIFFMWKGTGATCLALALLAGFAPGAAAEKGAGRDREAREASIASFEALLARYPESAMRAPVLLLLGDLYAEREKARYLEAALCHEEALAAGRSAPPPVLDYGKAIRAFEEVARSGADFPGSVEALHALGVCHDEMGRADEAERALLEATALASEPALRAASLLRLGELRFSRGNWEGAREAFEAAEETGVDAGAMKLDYRIGWCRLKQGALPEAGERFEAALARALQGDLAGRPEESLSEILRSLALVQVETDPGDLDGFAMRFPEGSLRRAALVELGEALLEHDRPAPAERAFRSALRMDAGASDAPDVHDRMIEALSAGERKREAGMEMEDFVRRYAPGGEWWEAARPEGDRADAVRGKLERNTWNAALLRFETGTEEDLRAAARLFEEHADTQGGAHKTARALLFAAESRARLGENEKSLALLERIDAGELPEEEREHALRGAVLAHRSLGRTDEGLARAAIRYAEAYPESEEARKALLVAAEREETAGRLSSAFALSARAAEGAAPPLRGEAEARAARLAAAREEKGAAEEWFLRAAASAENDADRKDRLERAAASAFLAAGDLEAEGDAAGAADGYARVVRAYRSTAVAADALLRETACRALFDEREKVLALADTAAVQGAGREETRAGLAAAAQGAARAGRDSLAARLYERAVRVLPRAEDLLGAGEAFERAGEREAARASLEQAAAVGAGTPLAAEALYRLGLVYAGDGENGRAAQAFDRAREEGEDRPIELLARAGSAWLAAGDEARAADRLSRAVRASESEGASGQEEEAHAARAFIDYSRVKEKTWTEEVARWRRGGSGEKAGRLLEERIDLYRRAIALRFEGTTETAAREAAEVFEVYGRTALLREIEAGRAASASLAEPFYADAAVLFRSAGEEGRRLSLYASLADTLIRRADEDARAAALPLAGLPADPEARAEAIGAALQAIERCDEKWSVAADLLRRQESIEGPHTRSANRAALALRASASLEEGAALLREAPEPGDLAGEDLVLYRGLVEEKARAFEARAAEWLLSLPDASPEVVPADLSLRGGEEAGRREGENR